MEHRRNLWPDALPDVTNGLYRIRTHVYKSCILTAEPRPLPVTKASMVTVNTQTVTFIVYNLRFALQNRLAQQALEGQLSKDEKAIATLGDKVRMGEQEK